jgi:hypothetical protein
MTAAPRRETTNYFKLPTWADDNHVHTVVETPRGSRVMVEFDPKLGEVPGMARHEQRRMRAQESLRSAHDVEAALGLPAGELERCGADRSGGRAPTRGAA